MSIIICRKTPPTYNPISEIPTSPHIVPSKSKKLDTDAFYILVEIRLQKRGTNNSGPFCFLVFKLDSNWETCPELEMKIELEKLSCFLNIVWAALWHGFLWFFPAPLCLLLSSNAPNVPSAISMPSFLADPLSWNEINVNGSCDSGSFCFYWCFLLPSFHLQTNFHSISKQPKMMNYFVLFCSGRI